MFDSFMNYIWVKKKKYDDAAMKIKNSDMKDSTRVIQNDFEEIIGYEMPESLEDKDLKKIKKTKEEVLEDIETYFIIKQIRELKEL